ncbi:EAL domain-containing protein [Franzmannia qiaohouensis]|uniref:EAL domain-containing protein n=1 Tax=Franzmannia qiaohouensis TaxID=1329370 RepID=A0ABU1HGR7_9GAMM|nr:EAL domain-containing protein [Halomonas qiaohouensis]MDR5905984.1 EAL domain-containing protein [Halomonas qiaohouensis]
MYRQGTPRRTVGSRLVGSLLGLLLGAAWLPALAHDIHVLASYHQGNPWTDDLVAHIGAAVERRDDSLALSVDYLDARRIDESEAFALHRSRLAGRLAAAPAEYLILLDDAALRFYLDFPQALGNPRRVVAAGINDPALWGAATYHGVRLVATQPVERRSLAFLTELFGAPLPLLVLGDRTQVGRNLTRSMLEAIDANEQVELFDVLWEWSPEQVTEAYRDAPPGTQVYLVEGQTMGASDIDAERRTWLNQLEARGIAVFCHLPYQIALGCDGGAVLDIERVAQLLVDSLLSHAHDQLPVIQEVGSYRYLLDARWRQRAAGRDDIEWLNVERYISARAGMSRQLQWLVAGLATLLLASLVVLGWLRWRMLRQRQRLLVDRRTGLHTRQALEAAALAKPERVFSGWLFMLKAPQLHDFRQRLGHEAAWSLMRGQLALILPRLPEAWQLYVNPDLTLVGHIDSDAEGDPEVQLDRLLAALPQLDGGHRRLEWYACLVMCQPRLTNLPAYLAALEDGMHQLGREGWQRPLARVAPYDESRGSRYRKLSDALREAFESHSEQFYLLIQPQLAPRDARLVGGELLVRWRHPHLGEVMPSEFLPIVDALGLNDALDRWVMEQGLCWFEACRPRLPEGFVVAVNITLSTLGRDDFLAQLGQIIESRQLDPACIELEITEHANFHDLGDIDRAMTRLRGLGVRLALDDFGTGHTAFQLLQRLPLNSVKLDRELLQASGQHGRARDAYSALVGFCQTLRLGIVAEGVETEEEAQWLVSMGIEVVQGFYFARPMPFDDFLVRYGKG